MIETFLKFWYIIFSIAFFIMLSYKILKYRRGDYGENQSFASRQIVVNNPKRALEIDIKILVFLFIIATIAAILKILEVF